jgi:Uma2 family endonuclease
MATDVPVKLLTAEEFMASDLEDGNFELVRGEVVQLPPTMPEHGRICVNVVFLLETYGRQTGYGYALSNDPGVVTERGPDTVRGPDICFFSHDRWPRSEIGSKLPPVSPNMVVEVYSPGNRPGQMLEKVAEYLAAGIPLVWVIYPKNRKVAIYRSADEPPEVLKDDAIIENVPELPGFRFPVADFFL